MIEKCERYVTSSSQIPFSHISPNRGQRQSAPEGIRSRGQRLSSLAPGFEIRVRFYADEDALEAVICARRRSIRDLRSRGVTGAITAASMAWAKPSGKHLSSLMYLSANSLTYSAVSVNVRPFYNSKLLGGEYLAEIGWNLLQ